MYRVPVVDSVGNPIYEFAIAAMVVRFALAQHIAVMGIQVCQPSGESNKTYFGAIIPQSFSKTSGD